MQKLIPDDASLIPNDAVRVFKGQIFEVYQWPQKLFDDTEATFEMLKRPDTVLCIGVTNDQKLIVIEDDQPHVGQRLSFPGGRVDITDHSVLAAAEREIKEETGYQFKNWRLVQVLQPHKKLEWFIYLFIASEGQKTAEPHLDGGERITLKQLSLSEVKQLSLDKAGYLGEAQDIFSGVNSVADLLKLPEFKGQVVDR